MNDAEELKTPLTAAQEAELLSVLDPLPRLMVRKILYQRDTLKADITDAKCAIYNITPQRTVDDVKDTLDEQIGFLAPQIEGMEKLEREMRKRLASEKQSRIKYQGLAYATMNAIDSFLGLSVRRGEGTTVDSFAANLRRMLDEIKRIRFDGTNAEYGAAKIGTLLKEAHQSVCSIQCLSQWKTSEGQQHSSLCRRITETLKGRAMDSDQPADIEAAEKLRQSR